MPKIFVTRKIPESGLVLLRAKGYEFDVSPKDGVLTAEELISALSQKPYDAVLCLLTDKINAAVFAAVPTAKIFANYAVGTDNIDLAEAKKRNIFVSNTPGVLTNAVAEHSFALMIAVAKRVVEADTFIRGGQYRGWAPELLLGTELAGKTLGIVGLGRIGSRVAEMATGFGMKIISYDPAKTDGLSLDQVLTTADFISIHVPLAI